MNEKLAKAHAALWQAYDQMTESHRKRVDLRTQQVEKYADQLSSGAVPDVKLSFAASDEAAFLEAEILERVVDELSRRHRVALAEALEEESRVVRDERAERQAAFELEKEQKAQMRIDAQIQALSTRLRDAHPVTELHAPPAGIMLECRTNPLIPANPMHLVRLLHDCRPDGVLRIKIEPDGQCHPWR